MGSLHSTFTMKLLTAIAILAVYSAIPERAEEHTLNDLVKKLDSIPKSWKHGLTGKFNGEKKPSEYSYLMGALPIPEELDLPEKITPCKLPMLTFQLLLTQGINGAIFVH